VFVLQACGATSGRSSAAEVCLLRVGGWLGEARGSGGWEACGGGGREADGGCGGDGGWRGFGFGGERDEEHGPEDVIADPLAANCFAASDVSDVEAGSVADDVSDAGAESVLVETFVESLIDFEVLFDEDFVPEEGDPFGVFGGVVDAEEVAIADALFVTESVFEAIAIEPGEVTEAALDGGFEFEAIFGGVGAAAEFIGDGGAMGGDEEPGFGFDDWANAEEGEVEAFGELREAVVSVDAEGESGFFGFFGEEEAVFEDEPGLGALGERGDGEEESQEEAEERSHG
jgi:hypothetical protein